MIEVFKEPFFIRALLAVLLISFISAVLGSFIMVRRMNYLAGSLSHGLLGGVGIGVFFSQHIFFRELSFLTPDFTAYSFAILAAFFLYFMQKWGKEELGLSMIWTVGMSIGIIFFSMSSQVNHSISSYLFGDIFFLARNDLYILLGIGFFLLVLVIIFYGDLLLYLFDVESARAYGYKVYLLEPFFLLLLSVVTVVLMKAVGVLLLIAVYALPVSTGRELAKSLGGLICYAMFFSVLALLVALLSSIWMDLPVGPVAVLLIALSYFFVKLWVAFRKG